MNNCFLAQSALQLPPFVLYEIGTAEGGRTHLQNAVPMQQVHSLRLCEMVITMEGGWNVGIRYLWPYLISLL